MSTRKGGARSRAPKHQNSFAFKHNKNSKKTEKILSSPINGVCTRCRQKIEWRKQYRKYKPLKQPGRCSGCNERNILQAYHKLCSDCCRERRCCAMCSTSWDEASRPAEDSAGSGAADPEAEIAKYAGTLRERERRALLRKAERGEVDIVDGAGSDSDSGGDAGEGSSGAEDENPSLAGAAEGAAPDA